MYFVSEGTSLNQTILLSTFPVGGKVVWLLASCNVFSKLAREKLWKKLVYGTTRLFLSLLLPSSPFLYNPRPAFPASLFWIVSCFTRLRFVQWSGSLLSEIWWTWTAHVSAADGFSLARVVVTELGDNKSVITKIKSSAVLRKVKKVMMYCRTFVNHSWNIGEVFNNIYDAVVVVDALVASTAIDIAAFISVTLFQVAGCLIHTKKIDVFSWSIHSIIGLISWSSWSFFRKFQYQLFYRHCDNFWTVALNTCPT